MTKPRAVYGKPTCLPPGTRLATALLNDHAVYLLDPQGVVHALVVNPETGAVLEVMNMPPQIAEDIRARYFADSQPRRAPLAS